MQMLSVSNYSTTNCDQFFDILIFDFTEFPQEIIFHPQISVNVNFLITVYP